MCTVLMKYVSHKALISVSLLKKKDTGRNPLSIDSDMYINYRDHRILLLSQ